jgi:uncharacterized membrane protein YdfJ with MMPL/SSD domain
MVWVIFAMVLCVALAAAVVGVVAVPARRQGRQVLTPKGEEMVSSVARSTDKVVSSTRDKTGSALRAARTKSASERGMGADAEPSREAS